MPLNDKGSIGAYHSFCMEAFGKAGPEPTGLFAGRLVSSPSLPDISGLKVLRAGLHLGEPRSNHFIPDHAWAMSGLVPEGSRSRRLSLTLSEAEAYLRGETLLPGLDDSRGWTVMQLAGLPLGWGKITEGRVQNHYPKGLRKG
jgi:NOL1/NOP2/fmu family ribosome biogenesis protein